ncbi:MAG: STAS domain-containing protein [Rhodobacteraceae bacterium]|nr:STAS domain-containing protein [Paracoccaceae bacterium]
MRFVSELFGASIVGAMVVIMTISFVSIVYTGPLEQFLDRGIGTTLLGASIMMFVGTLLFSWRVTVMNPQDLTAILLAGAAANIAAQGALAPPDQLFATVLMMIAVTAFAGGIFAMLSGRLRLTFIVRFIPYPVMGGFLAATGYLLVLVLGACSMLVGEPIDLWTLGRLAKPDVVWLWLPWLAVAAVVLWATKRLRSLHTLPVAIALTCIRFYVVLGAVGISLETASLNGLLLGPFGSGSFLAGFDAATVTQADWSLIAGQIPTILAVIAMMLLGAALNLSGIEIAIGQPIKRDRDFVVLGLANAVMAPTGGLLGFPGISTTILGHRLGLRTIASGLLIAGFSLTTALFGAGLLEVLPRGLFAATIMYLGLELLVTWLWIERKRLMASDFSIVLFILATSAAFGFLEALVLGLFLSIVLFVVSYSTQNFVHLRTTLNTRRSTIERDLAELDFFARVGDSVRIIEYSGYLFFGTAARMREDIDAELAEAASLPDRMILDFSRVQGIDASAANSLDQIIRGCELRGVSMLISGLSGSSKEKLEKFYGAKNPVSAISYDSLDKALQAAEQSLLDSAPDAGDEKYSSSFYKTLVSRSPGYV